MFNLKLATTSLPASHYIDEYSFFQRMGNLSGKSVIDLACGEGTHTRTIKKNGATQVIGIDISEKMIDLAKQEEAIKPLGIKYQTQDVFILSKIDEFDLVTAAYLLHYAKTREELLAMCRAIHLNLKDGGRFISINGSFNLDSADRWRKYGIKKRASKPIHEGTPITVTLFEKDWNVSFDNYYLSKDSYEWAFQQVGFKSFVWFELSVSPEGIEQFGDEFWQDVLKYPYSVGIECVK